MRERTGYIYSEMTNKGRCSSRFVRGCKPVYCFNWVAEITIDGKRHRKRNKNREAVERWLEDMKVRFGDTPIIEGAAAAKYKKSRIYKKQYGEGRGICEADPHGEVAEAEEMETGRLPAV